MWTHRDGDGLPGVVAQVSDVRRVEAEVELDVRHVTPAADLWAGCVRVCE